MKRFPLLATALGVGLFALALARLGAQDAAPSDKWAQIAENHKKMNQALDTIEQNLNFIKARSMSGGRKSP